jgi:hypothetical protein
METKVEKCQHEGCKKKLGLLGFTCKCEKNFCGTHRIAEVHKCTFDYHQQQKKDLLKYMSTKISAEKVGVV